MGNVMIDNTRGKAFEPTFSIGQDEFDTNCQEKSCNEKKGESFSPVLEHPTPKS
jgi:hypothetical protein